MLASNRPKADRDRLVACVTVLCEAVGRTPTMATYLAYEIGTEGITIEAIERATQAALRRPDRWMPSPGELRELAGATRPADRAALAFQALKATCQRVGAFRSPDFDDPLINATVRNLGGWLRACETPVSEFDTWYRKEFCQVYEMFCRTGATPQQCLALDGLHEQQNRLEGHETDPTKVSTGLPWANPIARLEGPQ